MRAYSNCDLAHVSKAYGLGGCVSAMASLSRIDHLPIGATTVYVNAVAQAAAVAALSYTDFLCGVFRSINWNAQLVDGFISLEPNMCRASETLCWSRLATRGAFIRHCLGADHRAPGCQLWPARMVR